MAEQDDAFEQAPHASNMHTVFLGDCTQYFQWMSMGMFYSHKKSGQPGPITRVMCCTEEQEAAMPKVGLCGLSAACFFSSCTPHNALLYEIVWEPESHSG